MKLLRRRTKMALVANPNAGKHTPRAGLGAVIGKILAAPPDPHRLYDTQTLGELAQAAKRIQLSRPDILAVAGGDGTLHQTLTSVLAEYEKQPHAPLPRILIVPIGTMNTVATALGANRRDPVELVKRVSEKIRQGAGFRTVKANILKINGEYGFLYGAGLPVHFLNRYYSYPAELGKWRSAKVIAAVFWDEVLGLLPFRRSRRLLTEPVHARIRLPDGHEPPVVPFMSHTGFMVATVDEIGFGCRALPDARSCPGSFMIRSLRLSFWRLAVHLARLWSGFGLPAASAFDAVVPAVTIEYEQPTVTFLDGDMRPPTLRDEIVCGPELEFIID
ncbi:MAG: diacylglycerol kinase family protein [Patescibacteria group bacterium]